MAGALSGRKIAVGVGGGIAAYKACELVRELGKRGAQVRVAMTEAAQKFVTALTFQSLTNQPVLTNYFDPAQEASFGHLELARWAELYVIAPATADLIARIRAGMGNDAVTTSLLAFRGSVLLAPAMNVAMFENRIVQENLRALAADPRFRTVGPGAGLLACGDIGSGRLSEVVDIAVAAEALLSNGLLRGKRVLITAGPTREPLDPVRFLSNPSTGRMGLALAEVARDRGAEVTVVLGPTELAQPSGITVIPVITAQQMADATLARVNEADYFLATAAVSDFRPRQRFDHKVKKADAAMSLELERTPDVLLEASRQVRALARRPLLVGFAAETQNVVEYARRKLTEKSLDFVVANDVSEPGAGFGTNTNRVWMLGGDGASLDLSGSKLEVAAGIWDRLAAAGMRSGG